MLGGREHSFALALLLGAGLAGLLLLAHPASADTNVSGVITTPTTWTAANSPYHVTGTVQPINTVLTIEAGVTVRFDPGTNLYLGNGPAYAHGINAQGTVAQPILFTSSNGQTGGWAGVVLSGASSSMATTFRNLTIEKAQYGLQAYNIGNLILDHVTIQDSSVTGLTASSTGLHPTDITIQRSGARSASLSNLPATTWTRATIASNAQSFSASIDTVLTLDGFNVTGSGQGANLDLGLRQTLIGTTINGNAPTEYRITGGSFSTATTLIRNTPNLPYHVLGTIQPINAVLTIEAGTVLRFDPGTNLYLGNGPAYAHGINAQGTTAQPILFTSSNGQTGGWAGVVLSGASSSMATTFRNLTIEKAQYGLQAYNIGNLILDRTTIQDSSVTGLTASSTGLHPTDITIQRSGGRSASLSSMPATTWTRGTIASNAQSFSASIDTTMTMDGVNVTGTGQGANLDLGLRQTLIGTTINGNAPTEYRITGGSFSTATTLIRNTPDLPYHILGTIQPINAVLTIEAGTVLRFDPGTNLYLGNGPAYAHGINAQGTTTQPILFTSSNGQTGGWGGVVLSGASSSMATTFRNLTIEKAQYGLQAYNIGNLILDHVTIQDSSVTGLTASSTGLHPTDITIQRSGARSASLSSMPATTWTRGTIASNAQSFSASIDTTMTMDGVTVTGTGQGANLDLGLRQTLIGTTINGNAPTEYRVTGGSFSTATTLIRNTPDLPYHVLGTIQPINAVLTIEAGTTLRFDPSTNLYLGNGPAYAHGINAQGTTTQPILFTSSNGQTGGWGGVVLSGASSSMATTFRNLTIEKAQYGLQAYNIGNLILDRVTIQDSSVTGLTASSTGLHPTDITIQRSGAHSVSLSSMPATTWTRGTIAGNAQSFSASIDTPLILDGVTVTGTGQGANLDLGLRQTFIGVTINGNAPTEYRVTGGSFSTATTLIRNTPDLPYHVLGTIQPINAVLTIEAGTILRFDPGIYLYLGNGPAYAHGINAQGTTTQPILFTSSNGQTGGWGGVVLSGASSSMATTFRNLTIEKAQYGLQAYNIGNLILDRVTIQDSSVTGLTASSTGLHPTDITIQRSAGRSASLSSMPATTWTRGTIASNAQSFSASIDTPLILDGVTVTGTGQGANLDLGLRQTFIGVTINGNAPTEYRVTGGSFSTATTLIRNTPNLPYHVLGTIQPINAVLTIEAGTTLRFDPSTNLYLGNGPAYAHGINAQGTTAQPIVLTSSNGQTGGWAGVVLSGASSSMATTFRNLTIEKAQYGLQAFNIGNLLLDHVTVQNDSVRGIDLSSSRTTIKSLNAFGVPEALRCTSSSSSSPITVTDSFFSTGHKGIELQSCPNFIVTNSAFSGNPEYGLLAANSGTVSAQGNYWGSPSGPSGVGPGTGDPVFGAVSYSPWLSSATLELPLPDLEVSADQMATVGPFLSGRDAVLQFTVSNPTPRSTPATTVRVKQDGVVLGTVAVGAMNPFDSQVLSLNFVAPVASTEAGRVHLYVVTVDPAGNLTERDRLNNEASRTFMTEVPSSHSGPLTGGLAITVDSGPHPLPGQLFQVTGHVTYGFVFPPPPASGAQVTARLAGITSTGFTVADGSFALPFFAASSGTFALNVSATDTTFVDSIETAFTVDPLYPAGVDLSPVSLTFSTNHPGGVIYRGEQSHVTMVVANLGANATAADFPVDVFLDDTLMQRVTAHGLAGMGATAVYGADITLPGDLSSAQHRFWGRVDGGNNAPNGAVSETNEGNNEICGFRQASCANFAAGSAAPYSPYTPPPTFYVPPLYFDVGALASVNRSYVLFGEPVHVVAGVVSDGNLDVPSSSPFTVNVSYDEGAPILASYGGMAAGGESHLLDFTTSYSVPGGHTVRSGIGSVSGESSIWNNHASASFTVFPDRPWLCTGGIVLQTTDIRSGQPLSFSASIVNQGGVPADVPYEFWYDGQMISSGTVHVPERYGVATVSPPSPVAAGGNHTLAFLIDPHNQVDEYLSCGADGTGHSASRLVTVTPRPDLVPSLSLPAGDLLTGHQYTLVAQVGNGGDAASPATTLCIAGWGASGSLAVPALGVGTSWSASVDWVPQQPQASRVVSLTADCAGAVDEKSEGNNVVSQTVKVRDPLPDLSVSLGPAVGADGHGRLARHEAITFTVTVTNVGETGAPTVPAQLDGVGTCAWTVPPLDVAASWTGACTRSQLEPATYTLTASITPTGPQLSTGNDQATGSAVVVAPQVQILHSDVAMPSVVAHDGSLFPVQVAVHNVGDVVAHDLSVGLFVDDTAFNPHPAQAFLAFGAIAPGDLGVRNATLAAPIEGLHIVKAQPVTPVVPQGTWYATRGLVVGQPAGLPLLVTPFAVDDASGPLLNDALAGLGPFPVGEVTGYWHVYALSTQDDGTVERIPFTGAVVRFTTSDPAHPVQTGVSTRLFDQEGILRAPFQVSVPGAFTAQMTGNATVAGIATPPLAFDAQGRSDPFTFHADVTARSGSLHQELNAKRISEFMGSLEIAFVDLGQGVTSDTRWHNAVDTVATGGVLSGATRSREVEAGNDFPGAFGVSKHGFGVEVQGGHGFGSIGGSQETLVAAATPEQREVAQLLATQDLLEALLEHPHATGLDEKELQSYITVVKARLETLDQLAHTGATAGAYLESTSGVGASASMTLGVLDYHYHDWEESGTSFGGIGRVEQTVRDGLSLTAGSTVRSSLRGGAERDPLTGQQATFLEGRVESERSGEWQALVWGGNAQTFATSLDARLEWPQGQHGTATRWVQSFTYANVTQATIDSLGAEALASGRINPLVTLAGQPIDWAAWGSPLDARVTLMVPVCASAGQAACVPQGHDGMDFGWGAPFSAINATAQLQKVLAEGSVPVHYTVELAHSTYGFTHNEGTDMGLAIGIPAFGFGIDLKHEAFNEYREQTRAVVAQGAFLHGIPLGSSTSGGLPVVPSLPDLIWGGLQHKRVLLTLGSPADLLVTDAQGHQVGRVDGVPVNTMPGAQAVTGGERQSLIVPADGIYTVRVKGTGSGPYHLTVAEVGGPRTNLTYLEVPTDNATVDSFAFDAAAHHLGFQGPAGRDGLFHLYDRADGRTLNVTGSLALAGDGAAPTARIDTASPTPDADLASGRRFVAGFTDAPGPATAAHAIFTYPVEAAGNDTLALLRLDGAAWVPATVDAWDRANGTIEVSGTDALTLGLYASRPDLVAAITSVPAAPVLAGHPQALGLEVRNLGTAASPATLLCVEGWGDAPAHAVPALPPGGNWSAVRTWTPSGADPGHTVTARADCGDAAVEDLETNNADQAMVDVLRIVAPTPPQAVAAAAGPAPGQASLSWSAPADAGGAPIIHYRVLRDGVPLVLLGNATSYLDTGLGDGATVTYQVTAANYVAEGEPSEAVGATTFALPAPPLGVVATPGAHEATLSWQPPASDGGTPVTAYQVYGGAPEQLLKTTTDLSYTQAGLGNHAAVAYTVRAVNAVGEGLPSAPAGTTTFDVPAPPQALVAQAGPGAGEVTLSWSAPASDGGTPVTGYTILRSGSDGNRTFAASGTNHTDAGLAAGSAWSYRIAAVNAAGQGDPSTAAVARVFSPPSAPQDVVATAGVRQVTLSWSAPASDGGTPVTGYIVWSDGEAPLASVGRALNYTDAGLPNGATRHYTVQASNLAGDGPRSAQANATTPAPPTAPTGLAVATEPGNGTLALTWSAPASDGGSPVLGYRIARGNGTGLQPLATVEGVLAYRDTGLANGATYAYAVAAFNAAGDGPASTSATGHVYARPDAPPHLAAVPGPAVGQVTLAWSAAASNGSPVTGYTVWRGTAPGTAVPLFQVGLALNYTDSGLPNGATRVYRVTASNLGGDSLPSAEANATTYAEPSAPLGLVAAPGPGAGDLSLSWSAPASDGGTRVTGYLVLRSDGTGPMASIAHLGDVRAYTDSGQGNSAERHYQVQAINAVGPGPASNAAQATTFGTPSPALGLTATAGPGAGQVTLSWSAPASDGGTPVTGYRVLAGPAGGPLEPAATLGNVLNYLDGGLPNGAPRSYQVAALNLAGQGAPSATAGTTVFDVPGAPRNLTAAPGVRQVTLHWQAPALDGGTPVTDYELHRILGGSETMRIRLGNVLGYTDSGLANSTAYTYSLEAFNLAGRGASASADATTWAPASKPLGLTPQAGVDSVHLQWNLPASTGGAPITGYRVLRGTSPGGETFLNATGTLRSYDDATAKEGTRYYYQVAAVTDVGVGAASSEVSARPYGALLQTGTLLVPPSGVVATVSVCDAGSSAGCQVPGTTFLCVQVKVTTGPENTVSCVAKSQLPAALVTLVRSVSPVQVVVPPTVPATTGVAGIQVLYLFEHSHLAPWATGPLCDPIFAWPDEVTWLQAHGSDTALEIRVNGKDPTGAPIAPVSIPYLGQVVAAAQAMRGLIPCG